MKTSKLFFILPLFILAGFKKENEPNAISDPCHLTENFSYATDTLTYLALGDSYTVGRLLPAESSYPYQLADRLRSKKFNISTPVVIAKNGWRTDELITGIANSGITSKFDFVTLLIGVNNQFQNRDTAVYRTEFASLLKAAIAFVKDNKRRVFVLSIPDWGATPFANGRNLENIAIQIDVFNNINKDESRKAGVNYIDITSLSRDYADDPSVVTTDKLHPSKKMYGFWVDHLLSRVIKSLK
jgi:lysophospholipase L1-like esterase